MAGKQEFRHEQLSAGLHSEDETQRQLSAPHEDDHEHHHKKSVLHKVKEKAKKWKQSLAKKTHSHSENAEPHVRNLSLDEDDVEVETDPEYHGAPMYESGILSGATKETAPSSQAETLAHTGPIHEPRIREIAINESPSRQVETDPEYHGAPMYESEKAPIVYKEPAPPLVSTTQFPEPGAHQLPIAGEDPLQQFAEYHNKSTPSSMFTTQFSNTRVNEPVHQLPSANKDSALHNLSEIHNVPALTPLSEIQFSSSCIDEPGVHQIPAANKGSSPRQIFQIHNEPPLSPMSASQFSNTCTNESGVHQLPTGNKPSSLLEEFHDESVLPTVSTTQFSNACFDEPGVYQHPSGTNDSSRHSGIFHIEFSTSTLSGTQFSDAPVDEPGVYQLPPANKESSPNQLSESQYEARPPPLSAIQFSDAHVPKQGYNVPASPPLSATRFANARGSEVHQLPVINEDSSLNQSGEIHHEPELVRQNSFKESSDYNHPSVVAAKNAADHFPTAEADREHDNSLGQSNNKSLTGTVAEMITPVYNAVSGVTDKIASTIHGPPSTECESGAKQEYDRGVSPKEYVMYKLEPSTEDRALSQVITETVKPNDATKSQETGVVERVKEAISSLLGNEDVQVTSTMPSSNLHGGEAEQVAERRLQYNE